MAFCERLVKLQSLTLLRALMVIMCLGRIPAACADWYDTERIREQCILTHTRTTSSGGGTNSRARYTDL